MPNGWYQVAYSDELAVGEVQTLRYFAKDLVAFRGEDGEAHVFDAHCPHLGAHLGHGGQVAGNNLRCPFHSWEFDGTGRAVSIPYAKRIPPRAEIPCWPVCERNGMLMVYYHKEGRPPAFDVPKFPEYESDEWTDYIRRDFVIRSQAQELAENSVDPAHFKYVHRTAELPRAEARTDEHVFRVKMDYPIVMGDQTQHGAIEIEAHGFGFGVSRFKGIVETTVVIGGTPIDEDHLHNRMSFMVKKLDNEAATAGIGQAFVNEISRQFTEDMPIWENKVYWERPVLCDGDGPIALLRKWGSQFY
jgi:phenylpropionate dioxygenase-like ring-hydroxylating dioxygenase large terminal subunit